MIKRAAAFVSIALALSGCDGGKATDTDVAESERQRASSFCRADDRTCNSKYGFALTDSGFRYSASPKGMPYKTIVDLVATRSRKDEFESTASANERIDNVSKEIADRFGSPLVVKITYPGLNYDADTQVLTFTDNDQSSQKIGTIETPGKVLESFTFRSQPCAGLRSISLNAGAAKQLVDGLRNDTSAVFLSGDLVAANDTPSKDFNRLAPSFFRSQFTSDQDGWTFISNWIYVRIRSLDVVDLATGQVIKSLRCDGSPVG